MNKNVKEKNLPITIKKNFFLKKMNLIKLKKPLNSSPQPVSQKCSNKNSVGSNSQPISPTRDVMVQLEKLFEYNPEKEKIVKSTVEGKNDAEVPATQDLDRDLESILGGDFDSPKKMKTRFAKSSKEQDQTSISQGKPDLVVKSNNNERNEKTTSASNNKKMAKNQTNDNNEVRSNDEAELFCTEIATKSDSEINNYCESVVDEENNDLERENDLSCQNDIGKNQTGWGDTYPIHKEGEETDKHEGDTTSHSDFSIHISKLKKERGCSLIDERNILEQRLRERTSESCYLKELPVIIYTRPSSSTDSEELYSPRNVRDENTEMVWDRVISQKQRKKKSIHRAKSNSISNHSSDEPNYSKTKKRTKRSIEDSRESNDDDQSDEKQRSHDISNEEREKLLLYLCYRSFELVDFKNDEVWKKISCKTHFKRSWQSYKKDFFKNLTNCCNAYPVPHYFCRHISDNYAHQKLVLEQTSNHEETNDDESACIRIGKDKSERHLSGTKSDNPIKKRVRRDVFPALNTNNSESTSSEDSSSSISTTISNKKRYTLRPKIDSEIRYKNTSSASSSCEEIVTSTNYGSGEKQTRKRTKMDHESENSDAEFNPFIRKSRRKISRSGSQRRRDSSTSSVDDLNISERNKSKTNSNDTQNTVQNSQSSLNATPQPRTNLRSSFFQNKSSDSIQSQSFGNFLTTKDNVKASSTHFRKPRGMFVTYEKENLLKYIQSKPTRLDSIKGNNYWKEMEASNICPGRTWHSLRNHFFKYLVDDLDSYTLDPQFLKRLKRICNR